MAFRHQKIKQKLDYWSQFEICKFAKARIIETFIASRLWYTTTFYNLTENQIQELQTYFTNFINFPHLNNSTVSKAEMMKLRQDGGIKLIDIGSKIQSGRIKWLMELVIHQDLHTHRALLGHLLGPYKGGIKGTDLFFTPNCYARNIKKQHNHFYSESINAMAKLSTRKKVTNIMEEHIFYNTLFTKMDGSTLKTNVTCGKNDIITYGQVHSEHVKRIKGEKFNIYIANKLDEVSHIDIDNREDYLIYNSKEKDYIKFENTSQKEIYNELITLNYENHHSKGKWEAHFRNESLEWEQIWEALNNPITKESTKTVIWEQIHLNSFTQYTYNKWFPNDQFNCRLCNERPYSRFHITNECKLVNKLWRELEPKLIRLHPFAVTETEKAFGLIGKIPEIILRNWLTFLFRKNIYECENKSYKNNTLAKEDHIKKRYNFIIKEEIREKLNIYKNLGQIELFERYFTVKDFLIIWQNEDWQVLSMFTTN